jgi:hypothetical protein
MKQAKNSLKIGWTFSDVYRFASEMSDETPLSEGPDSAAHPSL